MQCSFESSFKILGYDFAKKVVLIVVKYFQGNL